MAATPELIYCAGGNRRFAEIAIEAGFLYGAQLPSTVYFRPYFCDQNWKRPNREAYMRCLAEQRPVMASVLDWEYQAQLPEILSWAEEVAQFVEIVMIIPKVQGGVSQLPRFIGGKSVRLGYSVPTKHGATELPIWEFCGWSVHLLGGSPGRQMRLIKHLNVQSCDGNMMQKLAAERCRFWSRGKKPFTNRWTSIKEADGRKWGDGSDTADAPYEAFRRSCQNIMEAWGRL